MYFAWYGFGRMFIEGLRTDSLYIPGTQLRISQCLGLACFLVSAVLLTTFLILSYRRKPALAEAVIGSTNTAETIENSTEEHENGNEN